MNQELKKCTNKDCEQPWKPATEEYFYKQKVRNKKLGEHYILQSQCKDCIRKRNLEHRNKNIEESRKHYTDWYKDNKEYRRKYKDELFSKEEHIKVKQQQEKKWREDNRNKCNEYQQDKYTNRTHSISNKQWDACKDYFNNECAYCGLHISEHFNKWNDELKWTDFHKEHVDDNGANDLSNCVPSCKSCNSRKWEFEMEEWYRKQKFFTQERLKRIYQWLNNDHKKDFLII